eukprot:508390-Prymnesium_polylepis.1
MGHVRRRSILDNSSHVVTALETSIRLLDESQGAELHRPPSVPNERQSAMLSSPTPVAADVMLATLKSHREER